ncbi:YihY/virulence factor BrkB family protein [Deinococcus peraridilitoris]|uniref:Putative membrane protein n=1 Tax=Deinococcus peraridilitoris (strain DSM 19664 / LMG 22246 / CIP 109416 / KR-200) TaxID=937777 RepID=L0A625_DEIPD|nr:YihY/virulence factor BrkB family protein [Deinococcus peraridilitoris]AFZ68475.1 putative membrane protein [Deinococcus peraridilitoris DSM 19664]
MKLPELFSLLGDAAKAFSADRAPRLAAALAYYTIFALAPLLFMVIVIAGLVLGQDEVQTQLLALVPQNMGGGEESTFIKDLVEKVDVESGRGLAAVLGTVTLFMGATGLFANLQQTINALWGADPPPVNGFLNIIRTRLVSFALVVLIAVLILAYLIGSTILSAFATTLGETIGAGAILARLASLLLGIGLFSVIFAMIYKYLPDVRLQWREVWTGAIFTATLFTVGQLLISLYFARVSPGSVFGAAGSLVVLLLWIYYSSMILFFGAEMTWVYSQKYGSQGGGAQSPDKKQALAQKGSDIPTNVSRQEREAVERTPGSQLPTGAATPYSGQSDRQQGGQGSARGAVGAVVIPAAPVPGPGRAALHAVYSVLALPALTLFGVTRAVGRLVRRRR